MGLFDKLPKMVERDESEAQAAERAALEQSVATMWDWLRGQVDEGAMEYLTAGSDETLRQCLSGRALEQVLAHLDLLRSRNLLWSFPGRRANAPRIRVDEPVNDHTYVVSEFFSDRSRLEHYRHSDDHEPSEIREADGRDVAIQATIHVEDGRYWITDVALLHAG